MTLAADEEGHLMQKCHPIPVVGRSTTNPRSDSDSRDVVMPQNATPGCSDKRCGTSIDNRPRKKTKRKLDNDILEKALSNTDEELSQPQKQIALLLQWVLQ